MTAVAYTCPRCLLAGTAGEGAPFCPRCGLADVAAADARAGVVVQGRDRAYTVGRQLAVGDVCNLYHCDWPGGRGVAKVGRTAAANGLLANEAAVLRRLADHGGGGPFVPTLEDPLELPDVGSARRRANVLRWHPDVRSPDELYSIEEVRAAYPAGIDPRDMAWMWRRLLAAVDGVHTAGVVHRGLFPAHVLIEPAGHKLTIVGWCGVAMISTPASPPMVNADRRGWLRRLPDDPRQADVALAARTMMFAVGGDPDDGEPPAELDPALVRYFSRCTSPAGRVDPADLLAHFDLLIAALWGPRRFRVFTMPPREKLV